MNYTFMWIRKQATASWFNALSPNLYLITCIENVYRSSGKQNAIVLVRFLDH